MTKTHTNENRPISEAQRRAVVQNLPLVRMTLRRNFSSVLKSRRHFDFHELFQEGCLALVDAVRSHNRRLHGRFAGFAMARIHYAIAAFIHDRLHLIRVPFISHRRVRERGMKQARAEIHEWGDGRKHGVESLECGPRVYRFHENRVPTTRRGGMRPVIGKVDTVSQ